MKTKTTLKKGDQIMIEEDYVNFETAKLLKEKGFSNANCFYSYMENGGTKVTHWENELNLYPKPTLQTAMKWLREKGIIITIVYTRCSMQTIGSQMMFGFSIQNTQGELLSENTDVAYDSYEQAGTAAIKHSLENLV